MIDLSLVYSALPYLFEGMLVTLQITTISFALGFVLGVILGFLQTRPNLLLRVPINLYVTVIRGTPMLIQIACFYYVLPTVGIGLSPFWAAVSAIAVNSSAYVSQIIKSGIQAVGHEQVAAARVLGFSTFQIARYIVIPQAICIVFPSLISECVTLLKDSSLASVVGVAELYKQARSVMNQSYDVVTVFFLVACFYLFLTLTVEIALGYVERKMNWYVKN